MGVHAVGAAGDHFAIDALELVAVIVEGENLSRADECEVEGVEEEHDPLSPVVLERDRLELAVGVSFSSKIGGGLAYL